MGLAPTNQPTFPAMHSAGAGAGVPVGALQLPTQPRLTTTVPPKGTCLRVFCSTSLAAQSSLSVADVLCMSVPEPNGGEAKHTLRMVMESSDVCAGAEAAAVAAEYMTTATLVRFCAV